MTKKTISTICALSVIACGVTLSSCSYITKGFSSISSVDMKKYPGLKSISKAQEGMVKEYTQASGIILKSRLAAVDALVLDAEAIAANNKAEGVYDTAKKIAAKGKEQQKLLQAQIQNLTNAQDLDAIDKALTETKDSQEVVAEGFNELAEVTATTNAKIASTNKKGDMYIAQAMKHQAAAEKKIQESYKLLQDAQIMEFKLALKAATQSKSLVDAMSGASSMEKAALGVEFRPIMFFLSGLPAEFEAQSVVKSMWEEHAAQSNIKLNKKQVGDIKQVTAKALELVKKTITEGGLW